VRILFVNQRLDYASASSYSLDLGSALKAVGYDVRLCTIGGPLLQRFRDHGIETYLAKFNYFSYRKLIQFLREFAPDLIHVQNARSTHFGQRISSKLRVPHIVSVHRTPRENSPSLAHPLLAGVAASNEVIREFLVNDQGLDKKLIRVIKHGVNVDILKPDAVGQPSQAPDGASARPKIPVIGAVGRLTPIKGHHIFLQAARRVLDANVEAMFMIVGEGEAESGLRRLARELSLEASVTFSPHIPGRRELYRIFDVVVLPTLRGGVGTTALEAMAMGKPVIASAVGEVLHLVQNEKNGLLVPESDPQALAERIIDLLHHPERARTLGAAARNYVTENLTLETMVKGTREFYDDVQVTLAEQKAKV
jgi:glycosyltransferase involved in cell wall biosynthesis